MQPSSPLTRPLAWSAGLAYGLIIFCGLSAEFWVRSRFLELGDPATTAANLLIHQNLFRLGFLGELLMVLADLALGTIFYLLLRPINRGWALGAAFLRLAQAVVIAVALLASLLGLRLLENPAYGALGTEALQALSLLAFEAHRLGYSLAMVFFGLNCMVTGALLVRATWAPSILGQLLFLAGPAYLLDSLAGMLRPLWQPLTEPLLGVAVVAEVSLCLWLLWRGFAAEPDSSGQQPEASLR